MGGGAVLYLMNALKRNPSCSSRLERPSFVFRIGKGTVPFLEKSRKGMPSGEGSWEGPSFIESEFGSGVQSLTLLRGQGVGDGWKGRSFLLVSALKSVPSCSFRLERVVLCSSDRGKGPFLV